MKTNVKTADAEGCICVQLRKLTRFEYVMLLHGEEAAEQSREMERERRAQLERERERLTSGELLRLHLRRALSAKRRELSDRMLSSGAPRLSVRPPPATDIASSASSRRVFLMYSHLMFE